jgi:GDP-D-mannose 3',5'-epimerase
MKKALVLGAGGFIGRTLVKRLKKEGYLVRGADLKYPELSDLVKRALQQAVMNRTEV